MSKKKKKNFPIKYLRKGLFQEEDFLEEEPTKKKKGKRRRRTAKFSVHQKTRAGGKKIR